MQLNKLTLALLVLFPIAAFADPSISTDSNRDVNTSDTSKVTRDKKMAAEKNEGAKNTKSRTSESSAEKSRERSSSNARSEADSYSRTYTGEADINSLLIQQFQRHYERATVFDGMSPAPVVAFSKCKPTLNLTNDYPVIGYIPKMSRIDASNAHVGTSNINWRELSNAGGVVPFKQAMQFTSEMACTAIKQEYETINQIQIQGGTSYTKSCQISPFAAPVNENYPHVRQYALCRIAAHYWLTEAAQRITERPARSEKEVTARAQKVFDEMDADPDLFVSIKAKAVGLWGEAQCNNFLSWKGDFNGLNMRCGVFNVVGERIEVDGRPTLSENAIDGSKFKIALSAGTTITDTDEERTAKSERLADRESRARSHEDYDSNQNSVSMSRGTSSEGSRSSSRGRSGKTSVGVTPKSGAQ